MNTYTDKTKKNKIQSEVNDNSRKQNVSQSTFQLVDNRSEAVAQRKLQEMANNSPRAMQLKSFQDTANNSPQAKQAAHLQAAVNNRSAKQQQPVQKKENNTGLPDTLKSGVENLSGYSMDDVKVHYNSSKPAQLNAHAYAQGSDIHLASGQEKHLPHEAWHVVQQKQGRVKPTMQMKGGTDINDDEGLEKEADDMGVLSLKSLDSSLSVINIKNSASDTITAQRNVNIKIRSRSALKAYEKIHKLFAQTQAFKWAESNTILDINICEKKGKPEDEDAMDAHGTTLLTYKDVGLSVGSLIKNYKTIGQDVNRLKGRVKEHPLFTFNVDIYPDTMKDEEALTSGLSSGQANYLVLAHEFAAHLAPKLQVLYEMLSKSKVTSLDMANLMKVMSNEHNDLYADKDAIAKNPMYAFLIAQEVNGDVEHPLFQAFLTDISRYGSPDLGFMQAVVLQKYNQELLAAKFAKFAPMIPMVVIIGAILYYFFL